MIKKEDAAMIKQECEWSHNTQSHQPIQESIPISSPNGDNVSLSPSSTPLPRSFLSNSNTSNQSKSQQVCLIIYDIEMYRYYYQKPICSQVSLISDDEEDEEEDIDIIDDEISILATNIKQEDDSIDYQIEANKE